MKEINLGHILIENRHKHGITQEQLAAYMDVSKAAVSKWETGMTCPDITLLPRLAAYFNISIDELLGYKPQMEKSEIRKCYRQLAKEFSVLPFDEALEHCHELKKKYHSCFPLLFHIGSLLVNHSMLAGTLEKSEQVLNEARELFIRVKTETDDPSLGREALQMEAYCLLALKRPAEVLSLLDKKTFGMGASEPLLASAHRMMGNLGESKRILQIGIYKELLSLCDLLSSYLNLLTEDPDALAQTCQRFQETADTFHLEHLNPSVMLSGYLVMAQSWAALANTEKTLYFLEKYTNLAASDIYPLHLHGDSFFYLLDEWIKDCLPLGDSLPRDISVIRHSMTQALVENPAFENVKDEPRFQAMVLRLKQNEEEK